MPTTSQHSAQAPADGVHTQLRYSVANAAAREALSPASTPFPLVVGAACLQLSPLGVWDCVSISPVTWVRRATDSDLSGKENTGVASGLVSAHLVASDPHPQYATDAEVASAVSGKENTGVASGLVSAHAASASAHPTASGASAGFMSAADKTKLDGVAAGATAIALSSTTPADLGTPSSGTSTSAARADHVHAVPLVSPYAWTWPDAQTRTAQVVSAGDIGKVGYQTDLGRAYECVSTSVPVWGERYDPKWGVSRMAYWTHNLMVDGGTQLQGAGGQVDGLSTAPPTNIAESYKYGCVNLLAPGFGSICTTPGKSAGSRYTYGIRYRGMILQRSTGDGAAATAWWFGFCDTFPGGPESSPRPLSIVVGRIAGSANLIVRGVGVLVGQNQDIDLGANFPGPLLGEGYDIEVYSLDGLSFAYNVTRVNTGHCASGVVSSGYRPDPGSVAHGGWHVNGSQPYVSLVYFARWARGGAPI